MAFSGGAVMGLGVVGLGILGLGGLLIAFAITFFATDYWGDDGHANPLAFIAGIGMIILIASFVLEPRD